MPYSERRLARISNLIRQKISELLVTEIRDPRIGIVTISQVRLDRELLVAKVFWSTLGTEKDRNLTQHALKRCRKYLQGKMGEILPTRTVPRLEFHFDPSVEGSIRVSNLIDELNEERRSREMSPDPEAPSERDLSQEEGPSDNPPPSLDRNEL
jgi:ribosome-binding factor A